MDELCAYFAERRKKKGMTVEKAREIMLKDTTFFGAGLLAMGDADGVVSGSTRTSADTIKAGLQVVGVKPGNKTVCSGFIVLSDKETWATTANWSSGTAALSSTPLLNSWPISL